MPLPEIDETTFVAFTDISGFKILLNNESEAEKVLRSFYNEGFKMLDRCDHIKGLFISDCGILISNANHNNYLDNLKYLLRALKMLNSAMLEREIMLTTSIAFGRFVYRESRELLNMEKNLLYGPAYLSAYMDNENGKPKIQPGQCRIIVDNNLPQEIKSSISDNGQRREIIENLNINDQMIDLLSKRIGDPNHFYFYWMRRFPHEIEKFEECYTNAYQLKFRGFLEALKGDRDIG